jgi:hypothetical protein
MVRAVLSLNQVVSSAFEEGVAAVALPPPVVPAARPIAPPTAPTAGASERMAAKRVATRTDVEAMVMLAISLP